jgi:hypothetical protein
MSQAQGRLPCSILLYAISPFFAAVRTVYRAGVVLALSVVA